MLLRLYYKIWVDCLTRARMQKANRVDWVIGSMCLMSFAMTYNFAFIMSILQRNIFDNFFYWFEISEVPRYVGNVLSFCILFILPVVLLNYLLIIRNKRYEKLLLKYPYYNGKLFITYFLLSTLVPIILLIAAIIIR